MIHPTIRVGCGALLLMVLLPAGCTMDAGQMPGDDQDPDNVNENGGAMTTGGLAHVRFWAYQIQGLGRAGAVDALVASNYDLLVVDPTRTDRENTDFDTAAVVERLHRSPGSSPSVSKLVVAYVDIGEAEDWRTYWTGDWIAPTADESGEPGFLLTLDPDGWSGNYPVAFWDQRWKDIIIYGEDSVLQEVLDDGFDGIYMDWVEAYSNIDVASAAESVGLDPKEEMIDFIREIRQFARQRNPEFFVIPQNASEMAFEVEEEYLAIIDAIAQEQIYFDGDADTEWNDAGAGDKAVPDDGDQDDGYNRRFYVESLQPYQDAGLPVFTVDYAREPDNVAEAYSLTAERGYVPYVSLRPLDRLTETPPPGYPSP